MSEATAATLKSIAEILLGLGGLGGLAALIGQYIAKRKSDAEANQIEARTSQQIPADAAASLIDSSTDVIQQYKNLLTEYQDSTNKKFTVMTGEIAELRKTLGHYARRITYLLNGIQMLIQQIIGKGLEPCWTPDNWKPEFDQQVLEKKTDPGQEKSS